AAAVAPKPAAPKAAPETLPAAPATQPPPLPLVPPVNHVAAPKPQPVPAPNNSPLMVPVPKEAPKLPDSVNKRVDDLFNKEPKKEGILSDTIKIENGREIGKPLEDKLPVAAPVKPSDTLPP